MDVVLKDVKTGEPVVYLESLTTSSLAFAGATVYARGGKGHPKLIGWDSEKDVTLNAEDALVSKESLAVLTGSKFNQGEKPIHKKEVLVVEADESTLKVTLSKAAISSKPAFFYVTMDGTSLGTKLTATVTGTQAVLVGAGLAAGSQVIADYYYTGPATAQSMTITSDLFPGTYKLEGTTVWRNEDGFDVEAKYTIPKLKIQPGFTIGMASSGDPQPFTFTAEVLKDNQSTAMVIIDLLEE
jgi:hypothetical protein